MFTEKDCIGIRREEGRMSMAGKFCTNCGNTLNPGAVFCTNCGKRVDENANVGNTQQHQAPPAYQQGQPAPNYQAQQRPNSGQPGYQVQPQPNYQGGNRPGGYGYQAQPGRPMGPNYQQQGYGAQPYQGGQNWQGQPNYGRPQGQPPYNQQQGHPQYNPQQGQPYGAPQGQPVQPNYQQQGGGMPYQGVQQPAQSGYQQGQQAANYGAPQSGLSKHLTVTEAEAVEAAKAILVSQVTMPDYGKALERLNAVDAGVAEADVLRAMAHLYESLDQLRSTIVNGVLTIKENDNSEQSGTPGDSEKSGPNGEEQAGAASVSNQPEQAGAVKETDQPEAAGTAKEADQNGFGQPEANAKPNQQETTGTSEQTAKPINSFGGTGHMRPNNGSGTTANVDASGLQSNAMSSAPQGTNGAQGTNWAPVVAAGVLGGVAGAAVNEMFHNGQVDATAAATGATGATANAAGMVDQAPIISDSALGATMAGIARNYRDSDGQNVFESAGEFIDNAADNVSNFVGDATDNVGEFMSDAADNVGGFIGDAVDGAGDMVSDLTDAFDGTELAENLTDSVDGEAAGEAVDAVVDFFSDLFS